MRMNRNILAIAVFILLLLGAPLARAANIPPAGYALNFNSAATNYVSLAFASPPASNYTVSAWVYLRTGGTFGGIRMAVLSATTCDSSIELLIHSTTESATDPQYLELGRCSGFDGSFSTTTVPLNTWAYVAATFSSNRVVSYYINGLPAGTFTDSNLAHDYSLGTAVNLGDNSGQRRFDGMLDEVQLWNRVLSPAELQTNWNASLKGNESGLYAYYRCDEGAGTNAVDSATAGGTANGTLVNGTTWVLSGVPMAESAIVPYVGADQDLGHSWRTASVSKPFDIDGDNVLGTDGYYLVNRPAVLPNYVSQAAILTSTYPGNVSYSSIDDPINPGSLFLTGTMNPTVGTGGSGDLFRFTMNGAGAGRKIRIGLLVDNLDHSSFNSASLELLRNNGVGGDSGPVATASVPFNNQVPDWIFFDIDANTAGDVFVIRGVGGLSGTATLGGVAFDSIANTNIVTTTTDSGPGSLRNVVGAAPAGTTVTFASNLSGQTINLTGGPLMLSNMVSIDSSALPGGLSLSGGGNNQIITLSASANATLIGLTFVSGHADDTGGAIYSASGSSLHIARCTFTGNGGLEGGAILNDGTLLMENSTLTGNNAAYGGALQCRYLTTLDHCTITGNLGQGGEAGGIFNKYSTLTLRDCIVAGNSASGGNGQDIYSQNATLVFTNANLVQNYYNESSTSTGPAPLTSNPLLAPFGNYGGPTQTMPPLPGSPVIDAGGPTTLTVDQRGVPRTVGTAPDLGAVEFYFTNFVVTTTADNGTGSLRYAFTEIIPGGTVSFAPGLAGQTILLTNGPVTFSNNVIIDASALAGGVLINGNRNGAVFSIPGSSSVTLKSLTMTNASKSGINNAGSCTLFNCSVVGNASAGSGGGVTSSGTLILTGCTVSGNAAGPNGNGGGIHITGGSAFLTNCAIAGNSTATGSGSGGGITSLGSLNVVNCTFSSNSVPGGAGGGAIVSVGPMTLTGCTFSGNSATVQGGAIDNEWPCVMQNCTFFGNVSAAGGAILNNYDHSAQVTLIQCTLSGNIAQYAGGAIYNNADTVILTNSIVAGNTAPAGAGADIFNPGSSFVYAGGTNLVQTLVNYGTVTGANSLITKPPLLAALGNYGGPTPTMPPFAGSPAIDAGSDTAAAGLTTDQRGYPRVAGAHVDIGAVESNPNSIVTTLADSGTGSLRGVMASLLVPDLVSFAPNLSGQTILLTSGSLTANTNITIDASSLANEIQINGNSNAPVFIINPGVTAKLNLLTITNGYDFSGAYAGGIANAGNLTLNNCTVAGNGGADGAGGIYNDGMLTVNACTLTGNWTRLGDGGGIYNDGTLLVNDSTLAGNALANGNGGGLWNDGTLLANNNTFTGNTAGYTGSLGGNPARAGNGGALWNGGTLVANNNTFTGNGAAVSGGGIAGYAGQASLTNSIVAGNTAAAGNDISGNFIGMNNLTNSNPLLAPLANYGGYTPTMPPLLGSPALDAGSDAVTNFLATDQRGSARLAGGHVDLGAVEFQASPLVTTTNDTGIGSLRVAASYTTNNAIVTFAPGLAGQTILLTSGSLTLNHSVSIDASTLPNGMVINGNSNAPVFIVTNNVTASLYSLTITNGYDPSGDYAGGIAVFGSLTMSNCTVVGNFEPQGGGGLWIDYQGVVGIYNSTVVNNLVTVANKYGGGGILNDGKLTLDNCTVANNWVNPGNPGGGIYNDGIVGANNCTIVGNTALGSGGGIANTATLTLTNCIVTENFAPSGTNISGAFTGVDNLTNGDALLAPLGNYGGITPTMPPLPGSLALDAGVDGVTNFLATDQRGSARLVGAHVDLGAVEFQASPLVTTTNDTGTGSLRVAAGYTANNAIVTFAPGLAGQTILLTSGQLTLTHNIRIDASALANGMVINGNSNSPVLIISSNITASLISLTITNGYDITGAYAGGIADFGSLTISNCTIAGNYGPLGGGGLWVADPGVAVMFNSAVVDNLATSTSGYGGGGILNYGELTLDNCTIANNWANNGNPGGGIGNEGTLGANNCTIVGNMAQDSAGGIVNIATLTLTNCIVTGNSIPSGTNISGAYTGMDNLTNGDAMLAPLGNYGGPTQTMPPLPGSPALDAGFDGVTNSLATDQRGLPRLAGAHVDIGAVEVPLATASNPAWLTGVMRLGNGSLQFSFTNITRAGFTVLASTNLATPLNQWTIVGAAIENPAGSGQYQFTDLQATNNGQEFYRVRSP